MIRLANFMPKLQQQILVTDARLYGYHSLSMSYEVIMLSYSEMWGGPANQGLLQNTHTHTCLTALFPRLPGWAGTRKVKPIWILLKQETVSGSGISWATWKSAPHSRQITMPAPHHSVFYRTDAFLPPNQQRQSTEGKVYSKNGQ